MKNEMYFRLEDNGDLNGLYFKNMLEISQHIECDLAGIDPVDRMNVQYTISPVYMTKEEFSNLPDYQG